MKAIIAKVSSVAVVCMLAAGARADAPLSKKPGHDAASDGVKWTLHVGDKTYGMRPEGGSIPLPSELDWSCRYSQPRAKNHKDGEEVVVHVTCTRSDSRFAFTPVCTRGGHGDSAPGSAQSSAAQSVTLYTGNQIVVVGVSCEP
jgi:hypothetical protein